MKRNKSFPFEVMYGHFDPYVLLHKAKSVLNTRPDELSKFCLNFIFILKSY